MQLYLATTPDHLETARQHTPYLAHVAYRIGEDGQLHAQFLPPTLLGGLMVLGDTEGSAVHAPELLCRQILRVCVRRNFSGIVLDLQQQKDYTSFVQQLEAWTRRYRRRLYVPELLAPAATQSTVLICTAISGGSLQQRLEEAAARYAPQRIALDLQRLAMDFTLPSPSGEGTPLTLPELAQQRSGRCCYFSEGLCAHYFTRRHGTGTHFVLFDDAHTLQRKMALAEQLGINEGFMMLPEVEDLLSDLFAKKKEGEP